MKEKLAKIKLVAFDVDGVMTDSSLTFDENGVEYKTFNAKDGQGIVNLNNAGYITAIITARNNGTVAHRAKILNIKELYQGQKNKIAALEEIMQKYNLNFDEVAYMGDDTPDICVLEKVGLPCCPADAINDVKAISAIITENGGGKGAVRELCNWLIRGQNV